MSKCQLSESHRVKVNRPIYINLGVHRTIEYICPLVVIALIPSIFQGNEKDQRGCLPHKNTKSCQYYSKLAFQRGRVFHFFYREPAAGR